MRRIRACAPDNDAYQKPVQQRDAQSQKIRMAISLLSSVFMAFQSEMARIHLGHLARLHRQQTQAILRTFT
jgi:hypothetical protein